MQVLNLAPDLGPPVGCVILLLVEKDAQDVCGDSGTDQRDPDLENNINRKFEQAFGKKGMLGKLDCFGHGDKQGSEKGADPEKQLMDIDRGGNLVNQFRMVSEISHFRVGHLVGRRFEK